MQFRSPRFAEQLALSLALAAQGVTYHTLTSTEHAYGWRGEPYSGRVVFHTSTPFMPFATLIERDLGIGNLDLPRFEGIDWLNPIILHRRLRHARARLRDFANSWLA